MAPPDTVGQLKECEYLLRKNEMLFNMESDDKLIRLPHLRAGGAAGAIPVPARGVRAERAAAKTASAG